MKHKIKNDTIIVSDNNGIIRYVIQVPKNAIPIWRQRHIQNIGQAHPTVIYIVGWQKDNDGYHLKIMPNGSAIMTPGIDWELFEHEKKQ